MVKLYATYYKCEGLSMTTGFSSFAKDLARNPLGIIALFILLVYGFASIMFSNSLESLIHKERMWLIYFIIVFPVIVLCVFYRLVAKHHTKLYAPSDYKNDSSFFQTSAINHQSKINPTKETKAIVHEFANYGSHYTSILEFENILKEDLVNRNIEADLEDPVIKMLIRQLAVSQFLAWFEKTYNISFGSQLRLLQIGCDNKDNIISNDVINEIFQNTKTNNSELEHWTLDNYLKYLYGNLLIEKDNEQIKITTRGKEFMTMVHHYKYSLHKNL